MPDWSYRTVLRPLLFRLPVTAARDLSLGVMGALGRSRVGSAVIDLLGHMRPPASLRRTHMGLTFPAPVGLGCGLDPEARAVNALARFGFGFLEIGPVTLAPLRGAGPVERSDARQAILTPEPQENPGLAAIVEGLSRNPPPGIPLLARLAVTPGAGPERATGECRQMIEALAPFVDAFSVTAAGGGDANDDAHFRALAQVVARAGPSRALLACVPPDSGDEAERVAGLALAAGVSGVLVDGGVHPTPGRREIGAPAREPALRTVARLRRRFGPGVTLVGAGGVHEPEDALHLIEAGASLVQVDSGLVFSGPGLPKRIDDALEFATTDVGRADAGPVSMPPAELSWFWALLMGLGMLFGSTLALAIAMTRVVLPYDEQFAGLSRAQLSAVNDRLLPFMAHDRVTLAGTMIAIGVLYSGLSLFGIRRGLDWAQVAVLASACVGFGSFFLFLGFGYFDPFHAFVTVILFQFLLLGFHCRLGPPHGMTAPVLRDDRRWRLSQWGQLALVAHSTALVAAGLAICGIGVTQVFVPEDMEFMRTTREALLASSPHLLPLVAHDRASFGGMLVASGIGFLLASLWGFRRGAGWLWWTVCLSGLPAYAAAIGVHFAVGYHSPWHLAPAFSGLALFATAMVLCYPSFCGADPALDEAWKGHRSLLHRVPAAVDSSTGHA